MASRSPIVSEILYPIRARTLIPIVDPSCHPERSEGSAVSFCVWSAAARRRFPASSGVMELALLALNEVRGGSAAEGNPSVSLSSVSRLLDAAAEL